MIIGIFLRHIKTYKGITFIPLSDGSSFCGMVGENGIGKSAVLESLETFFHNSEWNINNEHIAKTKKNTPYIIPIFLIEKDKLKLTIEEKTYIEKIDNTLRNNSTTDLPSKTIEVGQKVVNHIQKVIAGLENESNYYIVALGLNSDTSKSFGIFNKVITNQFKEFDFQEVSSKINENIKKIESNIVNTEIQKESIEDDEDFDEDSLEENIEEEDDIEEDDIEETPLSDKVLKSPILSKLFNKITELYNYIYIPKELSAEEFTKLHNREFEILMGKTLNQSLKSFIDKRVVDDINGKLESLLSDVTKDLDQYTYKSLHTCQQKLKTTDVHKLITDAYFSKRVIHLQVDDKKPIPLTKLSSGEKQKAILNIASTLLKKNHSNIEDKYIIFAFDEPESSLHISACFDIFQQLYKTSTHCKQLMFTTHWYGYLPAILNGCTVIISKDVNREHQFDFIDLYKYREETKQLRKQSTRDKQLPTSIQLKSINDLVQSIVCGSMSENPLNWIICEGSSEKIYLSHFLSDIIETHNLRILPMGGQSELLKLYRHLNIAFKDFDAEISGKVFMFCDTDEITKELYPPDNTHKKLRLARLINNSNSMNTELVHMNDSTPSLPTELEHVLNSYTFIETLKYFQPLYPDELTDLVESNYGSFTDKSFTPATWAFRLNPKESKNLWSFFDVSPTIKSDFAQKYLENVKDKNDLPWIQEIKSFIVS